MPNQTALQGLRAQIAAAERGGRRAAGTLSLGDPGIDGCFREGGLPLACWHEIGGEGMEAETCAAPAAFAARIAASLLPRGEIVWILRRDDLYAPGLAWLGFPAQRLIQVCAASDDQALAVLEEALSTSGVAAAIAETEGVSLIAGRRLQLACEKSGAAGLVLHRRPFGPARKSERPGSAAASRWKIASAPSAPASGSPGLGPARWTTELVRCRGGRQGAWLLEEAKDHGPHPFRLVAPLGDERLAKEERRLAG